MAQATLQLSGSYSLQPPSYPPSSAQQIGSPIQQTNYVKYWAALNVDLTTDGPIAIPFPPGMTLCHMLNFAVQGGSPIEMFLTSADGTLQAIPVDPQAILYMNNLPVTAISVQRTTGVLTTLTYLIAQNQ